MNKASVHVTQPGNTGGLGDLLSAGNSSGNIIPVLYGVNANLKPDIIQRSPSTKLIYRRQSNVFARLPNDMWTGDPVQSATNWLTNIHDPADQNRTLIQNWALNPADYYDPLNEPAIDLPPNPTDSQIQDAIRKAQWLNTWMITALEIAHSQGMSLAMFSFNTGGPAMQAWPYLFPAIRKGKQYGAIISLHEYGVNGTMQNATPGNVLRYRDVWSILPTDCRIPIVITECGAGNGYDTLLAGQTWADDLMWYNRQTCQNDYLMGFCAFQLGGNESNMTSAIPAYAASIQNFICQPHIQKVESEDGSTIPSDPELVDSTLAVWTLGSAVPMGRIILKNGTQFAGGQGDFLLYWGRQIYTHNAKNEWYVAGTGWTRVAGDPRSILKEGVDVSVYQGSVNWGMVSQSISYAFIRSSYGNRQDNTFTNNWASAKSFGIPRGAYHYYKFSYSPTEQYNTFMAALGNDIGEMSPVVDLEDEAAPISMNDLKSFVDLVESRLHRAVMIYTADWYIQKYHIQDSWLADRPLWVASYTSSPLIPPPWTTYLFWQYGQAPVTGIALPVDKDRFNGDLAAFQRYLTHLPVPPVSNATGLVPVRSVNGRADGGQLRTIDVQGAKTSPLINGYKLYKNAKEDYASLVANGIPITNVLVRLEHVKDRRVAADFYINSAGTGIWDLPMTEAYTAGVRWFEPFNEVNLGVEGNGIAWTSIQDFCTLYKQVVSLARAKFPQAKFLSTAISPAPETQSWWNGFNTYGVFAAADGYAGHSYWDSVSGTYPMDSNSGGRHYRGLFPYLTGGKKVYITEAANNMALDSDAEKGLQYAQYVRTMEDKVARVDFFCISSSNVGDGASFNSSRQTWVRPIGGVETISDIPKRMV